MESNDTWAFDMQTTLQPMFGLLGISDGTGDFTSVLVQMEPLLKVYL